MEIPELYFFNQTAAEFLQTFNAALLDNLSTQQLAGLTHFLRQATNVNCDSHDLAQYDFSQLMLEPFFAVDMEMLRADEILVFDEARLAFANGLPFMYPRAFRSFEALLTAYLLGREGVKYEVNLVDFDELSEALKTKLSPYAAFSYPIFEDFDFEIEFGSPVQLARILTRAQVYFYLIGGKNDPAAFIQFLLSQRLDFAEIGAFIARVDDLTVDSLAQQSLCYWIGDLQEDVQFSELKSKNCIGIHTLNKAGEMIAQPCRTKCCHHLYFFELEDYRRAGKCPLCGEQDQLYSDKWAQLLLDGLKQRFSGLLVKSVQVDPLTLCVVDVLGAKKTLADVLELE